jgi:hypothetical protein
MFSRFLTESAGIIKNDKLLGPAEKFRKAGNLFSSTGSLFKESEKAEDLIDRIEKASNNFMEIYEIEKDAFVELSESVKTL